MASPLATAADLVIALHSGDEATVSTKSYLNSLAAHDLLAATLTGTVPDDVRAVAKVAGEFTGAGELEPLAAGLIAADHPRLAYIGFGDYAATALYAGLITKEGAKVAAEGYIGGQFRHGPLELAGPGLVAVLFGSDDPDANASLQRLGADLAQAGLDRHRRGRAGSAGGRAPVAHPGRDHGPARARCRGGPVPDRGAGPRPRHHPGSVRVRQQGHHHAVTAPARPGYSVGRWADRVLECRGGPCCRAGEVQRPAAP